MPVALLPDWLGQHAPPLLVVIPLVAGVVAAMLPWPRVAWGVLVGVCLFAAGLAALILAQTLDAGVWSYALGSWPPPLGIEYRVDALNALMLALIAATALVCAVYAPASVAIEIPAESRPLFYGTLLICLSGLLGVVITGDAFNVFVFLEISSISAYALVAMGAKRDRRALRAAYDYLIVGTIGATFFVIGVGFLYMATGTLNMADIAARLQGQGDSRAVQAGFAFVIVGLGLKLAIFPLHAWLPNAYAFAPAVVTAFFSATATKAALVVLIRFLFGVFGADAPFAGASLVALVAPLGAAGMIVASAMALLQSDVRRLFAWSSVAQIGAILLALGLGGAAGVSAGVLHLVAHALAKGALFLAIGAMCLHLGETRVAGLRGAARTMPGAAAALAIGAAGLVGIPGTAGFVSKWALLSALLQQGWWWAVAALAAASVLTFLYVGRVLERMYLRTPNRQDARPALSAAAIQERTAIWALAGATILFGVWPSLPVHLAGAAAAAVLGAAP